MIAGPGNHNLRTFLRSIWATFRDYWITAESYQKFAYSIAGLLIGSAIFHVAVLAATGGGLEGPVSWRKPILFGEGFGLTTATVAWLMSFLPKRQVIGWLLMGNLGVANLYEVAWVSLQQWRGVPSHFNFSTPFDAQAFSMAGIMIAVSGAVILLFGIWTFVSLRSRQSLVWAIRFGMAFLLLSQVVGFLIIQNGVSKVIDPQTGQFISQNLATASVFGAAGSMKIPHALTLHAIQLLPLIALLLQFSSLSESKRTQMVLAAVIGYGGIVTITLWQTFHGKSLFDLTVPAGIFLGVSIVFLMAVLLMTVKTAFQNSKHAAQVP